MLVIFDVEGVLYDAEYLPLLAKLVNKEKEIMDITLKGIRGEIPWEEGLLRRIDALRGIKYEDALRIAKEMPLMPGAKEVCYKLKRAGWRLIAVSGGFTIMMDKLKEELGLDYIASNELIFNDGILTGVDIMVNSNKVNAIAKVIKEFGESKENIVSVVDGANDLKLFDIAGLRVAFNAHEVVTSRADVIIDEKDLRLLIPAIEKHYGTIEVKNSIRLE
ncbi:MAG: phosphoserine phosphatase SerB [Candidatus Nitrosothermus koennekii]|nr:MAG: phosphoserine phosphatase SerB [Candidatus Nitrosothermus koennekii]